MERFAVLWFWENRINNILPNGLIFDKLICIKKTPYAYVGFFTVNSDEVFGQIIVKPSGKNLRVHIPYLLNKSNVGIIRVLDKNDLIIDNRDDFDWIPKN